jgi:hypothetical protein
VEGDAKKEKDELKLINISPYLCSPIRKEELFLVLLFLILI